MAIKDKKRSGKNGPVKRANGIRQSRHEDKFIKNLSNVLPSTAIKILNCL